MKYRRNNSFQLKEIAGDHVLIARGAFAKDFCSVVLFNEAGVFIWQHLDEPKTPEELAELLIDEFNAPNDSVLSDVNCFLEKMLHDHMILLEEK